MYENARGRLGASTISPMADLMTPIFPFNAPANARLMMMPINECDSPKQVIESVNPSSPVTRTGFLPILSDRRPHWRMKHASVIKKRDSCADGQRRMQ
jgi:hypothetical protein